MRLNSSGAQFCASIAPRSASTVARTGPTAARTLRAISSRWLLLRLSQLASMKRFAARYSLSPPPTPARSSRSLPSPKSTSMERAGSEPSGSVCAQAKEVEGIGICPTRDHRFEADCQQSSTTAWPSLALASFGCMSAPPGGGPPAQRASTRGSVAKRGTLVTASDGLGSPAASSPAAPPGQGSGPLQTRVVVGQSLGLPRNLLPRVGRGATRHPTCEPCRVCVCARVCACARHACARARARVRVRVRVRCMCLRPSPLLGRPRCRRRGPAPLRRAPPPPRAECRRTPPAPLQAREQNPRRTEAPRRRSRRGGARRALCSPHRFAAFARLRRRTQDLSGTSPRGAARPARLVARLSRRRPRLHPSAPRREPQPHPPLLRAPPPWRTRPPS
mmetsp:Transcript_21507/g.68706  ORF Transcript_21507/g.68706 Transcript_21507/m.68706 type:complete len:390 (-) Transcript_21507:276-1445(-)